jgi:hypothetical protein
MRLAQAGGGDEDPANAPSGGQDEPAAPGAVAAVNPVVYFAPQDNDANATVLVLFNTTSVTQTVTIQAFAASGTHTNFNVVVGGNKVVHAVSDSVIASPPPSFANSVVVNFTDFTTYAVMTIPVGIKFDGYLIFNPGTGTVDPRADQGAIPLRFSADPLTVLLPTVLNKP